MQSFLKFESHRHTLPFQQLLLIMRKPATFFVEPCRNRVGSFLPQGSEEISRSNKRGRKLRDVDLNILIVIQHNMWVASNKHTYLYMYTYHI